MSAAKLNHFPACYGMSEDERNRLEAALERRSFSAGTYVFMQGDPAEACFFLEEGRVAVRIDTDGKEETLSELGAGAIFGELGMVLGEPRSASVYALTDVTVAVLPRARFTVWLTNGEHVALQLLLNTIRVQTHRLRELNRKFVELLHRDLVDHETRADLESFRQKLFGEWSF